MRKLNEFEINNLVLLTENSVEYTLIEPTQNGLKKSIFDATGPVRTFLKNNGFHDYSSQNKGQFYKVHLPASILTYNSTLGSIASLYRPETKDGDPRIWFTNIKSIGAPNEIIAIIGHDKQLYLFNISKLDLRVLLKSNSSNPIKELILGFNYSSNEVASELLTIMRKIADIGLIPAHITADTSIGRTLESLLGISINSSKSPDYKGIEIKSFRNKSGNRKTLFAQVPDWSISKFKSSSEILMHFGYKRGDNLKLYCTVSATVKNSQGLMLKVDDKNNRLIELSDIHQVGEFIIWPLEILHKRLVEKHNETFWISADSIIIEGKEYFKYKDIEHTQKPIISQFDILINQGIITVDHLIKKQPSGKVMEKGPLFKIKPNRLNLLFPPSRKYNLTSK